ncbi:MAG: V-type ATP synthase subunit E [Verrucomicrobiota bacterium]|nr:V-type ATP synthase subunit E [Verrucomicrobiota bacterium]
MRNLETGKEKIQKICDAIRKETLEPAKQEAREIVENAHLQASAVIKEAVAQAESLKAAAASEIEEKKRIFEASLHLSCRQGIELLKQKIEQELFNAELADLVKKEMTSPKIIIDLIESFMRSLEEQGIEEDFEVVIPKEIPPRSINSLLSNKVLDHLKDKSVVLGDFQGGVQIRMKGRQITIDISDAVVRDLIARYIRRDLRDLVFKV